MKLSEKLRALSGFLLIATFLVLGSCPLKKAVHSMIASAHGAGELPSGSGKTLASAVCSSADSLNKKIILPERQSDFSPTLTLLLVIAGSIAPGFLFRPAQNGLTYRGPTPKLINAVPVYLRNRLLLI